MELFRRFLNTIDTSQLDDIIVQFAMFIIDDPSLQGEENRGSKQSLSSLRLETNDLTRQLAKKGDIYNYYFAFLKLVSVWNKVSTPFSVLSHETVTHSAQ